jgi:hypothetical protein
MKRHLPLILVSVVVVLCVVGAIAAGVAAGSGFSPVAFSVYGSKVSQSDFDAELHQLSQHPDLAAKVLGTPVKSTTGSIPAAATAAWLGLRIPVEMLRHEAAVRGKTLTAASRKSTETSLSPTLQQAGIGSVAQIPSRVRTQVVDYFGYRQLLKLTDQTAYQQFVTRGLRRGNLTVDPRYAKYGPRGLCPTSGCATAASSGTGG